MLTRVENALESRPDATQESTSSRVTERVTTQISSHAGGDLHDATAQVLSAGNVVGSAAQSLVGGSGSCAARTSIQDLIDIGGCASSQANVTLTGGRVTTSRSRESVDSNLSNHSETTRTRLQYEKQL